MTMTQYAAVFGELKNPEVLRLRIQKSVLSGISNWRHTWNDDN